MTLEYSFKTRNMKKETLNVFFTARTDVNLFE